MARNRTKTLPLIPLPQGTVLFPGVIQRIYVASGRPDIAALLAAVYTKAAAKSQNARIDAVSIACVPIASPYLSADGQLLIQDGERSEDSESSPSDVGKASASELFSWGVSAKLLGVEGRGTGEVALLVEGVTRIKIDKIQSEKPYFEAKVTYFEDQGMHRLGSLMPPPLCRDIHLS
ncbi:hypothetical protein VTK73DRAFT_291 [Phialemonium thermophilum]|uniref:Lon N-terminal domain-containing protein n=1 Tax=Phialemonium thermophilum TaxID=223376 RepID=A0ABR3VVY1_9PEZI